MGRTGPMDPAEKPRKYRPSPVQSSVLIRTWRDERMAFIIATLAVGLVASLLYTPLVLVALLVVPSTIYFSTRPYELLLLMVFFIPFNFVFKVGPLPVAFEVIKVVAWIPFLITRDERDTFRSSRYNRMYLVLGLLIVLSLVRAHDFPYTLKESIRLSSNLGLVYLVINLVDSRDKALQVLRVLALSTFVVALYGFYQWAIQGYGALFWIVNPRLETSLAHYRDDFWEWRRRIISVLTSEMELGHYFNLGLPIGVMLWITEGRRRLASKWLWITIAMLAGLVLTFTFGAWLALGATCALAIFRFGGQRKWTIVLWATVAFSAIAAFLGLGPLSSVIVAKASGTAIGSLAWDAATRLYGWKLALQAWWSHPLIGLGIGNFEYLSASYDFVLGANSQGSSPHETYLYLLANFGLVGTAAFLVILVRTIRENLRVMRSALVWAPVAAALAFALANNMIGWFADDSGFFGPHASYVVWLLVGLSEAISLLSTPAEGLEIPT
jgi:O-antigen ligase/polysaccharide polymerase Wzy-like membrane protein